MLLKGKRIIVTGGMTGIGKATVLACVKEGAKVVSFSRAAPTEERVKKVLEAANELGAGQGQAIHLRVDISDKAQVINGFEKAVEWMGGVDGLVNSAAMASVKPAEDLTKEDVLKEIEVNVLGTIFTNQLAFRYMSDTGGSIVNYSSFNGVMGGPGMPAYSTTKGAVLGWSRTIAKDWGRYGIRVNIVVPGVQTELEEKTEAMFPESKQEGYEEMKTIIMNYAVPLGGKLGKPEDAANLNVFLLSDMSSYMTGQTIGVDGGMMMSR